MNPEPGDLIENLDIENIDHAEKFLLATESRIDGKLEFICGNNNRWRLPDNAINLGPVVVAYTNMRKLAANAVDGHNCSCSGCVKDRQTFLELTKQNTKHES